MNNTKLEVVNECIATMGESPLESLDDDHAYKAAALAMLAKNNRREQKRGWWFNSEYVKLVPDVSGYVYVPLDAISVKTVNPRADYWAARGNRLYNRRNNNYLFTTPVLVDLVRELAYEDLPQHAADAVSARTVWMFQKAYDADTQRMQILMQEYREALAELKAEDVQNERPNMLASPQNIALMAGIGGLSIQRGRIPYTPGWPN